MKTYLLIDSTYRDRIQFPNPASFDIPFQYINSQIMNLTIFNSTNPITIPYPDYNFFWTPGGGEDLRQISGTIVGGAPNGPILDESINQIIGINGDNPQIFTNLTEATNLFQNLEFIFNGLVDSPYQILGYDPVTRILVLDGQIQDFEVNVPYIIQNNSTAEKIFIQGDFALNSTIIYLNDSLFLYDVALNEINPVLNYNSAENSLLLGQPFSDGWQVNDPYMIISKQRPINYGTLLPFSNGNYFIHNGMISFTLATRGADYSQGEIVYAVPMDQTFTGEATLLSVQQVDSMGQIYTLSLQGAGSLSYPRGTICVLFRQDGSLPTTFATIVVQENSMVFHCQLKDQMDFSNLLNCFFNPLLLTAQFTEALQISGNISMPVRNKNMNDIVDLMTSLYKNGVSGIRHIIPVSTNEAYLFVNPFPTQLTDRFLLLKDPKPVGSLNFLILPFSREGVVPLNFTGTQLTQSQTCCYRMAVSTLILPNLNLNVGIGPLTSSLPFVFLEISNVTQGRNTSVIYSNNPYTTYSTFVCSISDVNNPLISKFIKISSDGSYQTIKFTPVDTLRFRISLPDGSTFTTERTDFLVPIETDSKIKINTIIKIERIE